MLRILVYLLIFNVLKSQDCCNSFIYPETFTSVPVFIVIGQSNAMGCILPSELNPGEDQPHPEIRIASYWNEGFEIYHPSYNANGFSMMMPILIPVLKGPRSGMEISISQNLLNDYDSIYMIKGPNPGSSLHDNWSPDGNTWLAFKDLIHRCNTWFYNRQQQPEYLFIVWHQGESDLNHTAVYYNNLVTLHKDIKELANMFYTPFIITTINDIAVNSDLIRQAHLDYATNHDNAFYIETNDLSYKDNLHLDATGQRDLGDRVYNLWKSLQQ